ncbi:MAG: glycosyltransferase family 2 protein [Candidatus Eremiobacteraeota bacterium]|nr:glycosyltransferase family 2 protein [Candidatus Eremiobacteraeota bacterium]MBC5802164.1 glycosyltransferase family 2 protein [Candidatus Eremiobacteraeota bacterium]MBC5821784.1 glycosyltransferase family 2 protein [Candidatus Eremiobacteraeota bacterium]
MSRALGSVPSGSPLLVIDAESRDATVAVARAHGARTLVRPWGGFIATRRFALSEVATPWTFMLDADEVLDAPLRAGLRAARPGVRTDGYAVTRVTYFCGRPMRGGPWSRESPLRLFRTASAALRAHPAAGGAADVHERWSVAGNVERLAGTLHHHSYPSLRAYGEKFARYTTLEAQGAEASLRALTCAGALACPRIGWSFIVRAGWRDGWRGAYVAIASALYPVVVAWKARREHGRKSRLRTRL